MSPIANSGTATSPLASLYACVGDELREVEALLRQELRSRHPGVDELVRYGCLLGGKRLRPALLLLAGKAVGGTTPEHRVLATVVEMIHTATLVHDDVLDEADTRRHLATINVRWNNESSVLLGDFLFSHAFYLAATLDSTFACQVIGRSTNVVCEGELRQIGSRGNWSLSEDEYLEIIDAKTAELCACSCLLGAHYAGGDLRGTERLRDFGRNLGIAFQIADDVLDVVGDEQDMGKSLGSDLEKQKPTLPLIRVLQLATPAERAELDQVLAGCGNDRPQQLAPYLERYDALEYARGRAQQFADRARACLEELPTSPAAQALRQMSEFVVQRSV